MTTADGIRRRLARLGGADPVRVHFVDADESDPCRHPDGPEVAAEIAAIEAADPRARVILMVTVDGRRPA